MGAYTCINKQGGKNEAKRDTNEQTGCFFERMLMCEKWYMLPKMIVVLREGQGEEERANKPRALRFNAFKERENRKTIERRKKKTKPGHTNMVTQGHKCNKKG